MTASFSPISVQGLSFGNPWISRKRNPFNDLRSYNTFLLYEQRLQVEQHVKVQQVAQNNSQASRFYHFLSNKNVPIGELIKMTCTVKPEFQRDRHILVLGDSSSLNLGRRRGRIQDIEAVGVLNDDKTPGFHLHASLPVDAQTENVGGLADILYWSRAKSEAQSAGSSKLSWQDKESYKWALGVSNSKETLRQADRLTFVFDREADSFELFEHLLSDRPADFIIRAQANRKIRWQYEELLVNNLLSRIPVMDTYDLDLPPLNHYSSTLGKRVQRKARTARIEIRYAAVELLPPRDSVGKRPIPLYIVEAREITQDLPENESPVRWRLWTTHPVESVEQARQIIYYYTRRWIIEQLFRTLKKKGFNLEDVELETFSAILRQTTMVAKTACTALQLTYARDRLDCQATGEVFDHDQRCVLQLLNEQAEGKTEKLKNPFPQDRLSWAAWVIARLGGWKGYRSQKPPGPITFKRGLEKFAVFVQAYKLFNDPQAAQINDNDEAPDQEYYRFNSS